MNGDTFQPNFILAKSGNFEQALYQNGIPVLTGLIPGGNITLSDNFDGTFTIAATTVVSGQAGSIVSFYSNLAAGFNQFWISYPTGLTANPVNVVSTLQSSNPTQTFGWLLSGISISGHYLLLSNNLPNNSYTLNSFITF